MNLNRCVTVIMGFYVCFFLGSNLKTNPKSLQHFPTHYLLTEKTVVDWSVTSLQVQPAWAILMGISRNDTTSI